jgi:[ribosomal protein S5]-alanine N-acetyltransferase
VSLARDGIRLVRLSAEHAGGMEALAQDPDVQRNTYVPVPPPAGYGRTWVERYEEARVEGSREAFAILDERDGSFLGFAAAVRVDDDAREAELGYVVAREARGRGVASIALGVLTDWCFKRRLERIELRIDSTNKASMRVAERCGYTHEGTLRSMHFKQGMRSDVAVYSRLASDRP